MGQVGTVGIAIDYVDSAKSAAAGAVLLAMTGRDVKGFFYLAFQQS